MTNEFPDKIVDTPFGWMPQGEFLQKVEWPEEQKQFFTKTWQRSPELSFQEVLHLQEAKERGTETNSEDDASSIRSRAKNLLNSLQGIERSAIELPKIGDEDEETRVSLSSVSSTPLKTPKFQSASEDSSGTFSMASLSDTMAFKRPAPQRRKNISTDVADLSQTGKLSVSDLYKTGKKQIKRQKRRPTREGGDFLAAKCKRCSRLIKITPHNAGKKVPCKGCRGPVSIPDAGFYLCHDLGSPILGPFPISKQVELVKKGKIDMDMYVSLDQVRWKTIERAGHDLLMLIVAHDPREAVRQTALDEIDDQLFLFKIVMAGRDPKICHQAVKKITDQRLLDRIIIYIPDNAIVSSALRNLFHPGLVLDYAEAIEAHGWTEEVIPKVKDETTLVELANSSDENIRQTALEQLERVRNSR